MGKATQWGHDLLALVFNNTTASGIGDATGLVGSTIVGSLYLSLHTASPGIGGNQTTNETAYTGYARKAVARTGAAFNVTDNVVSLVSDVDFGECTASPGGAITYVGIGTAVSGAGKLLYFGAVSPNITMNIGVLPRLQAASTITEE